MKPFSLTRTYKLGTRTSRLALRQVEEVVGSVRAAGIALAIEIVGIDTAGDKDKITPISAIEGSDFFTREIEQALLNQEIDLAVHSAKDLPDCIPAGLRIAAITACVDPADALVARRGVSLDTLPRGATIAASSRRRKEQLTRYRDDFNVVDIRGTIEERLEKFDRSDLDALIIAACALKRLGLEHRISQRIPVAVITPHPLQGCLAVETRADSIELNALLSTIY